MKTILTITISIIFLISCENQQKQIEESNNKTETIAKLVKGTVYGKPISEEYILSSEDLPNQLKEVEEISIKLKGQVNSVCQMSGCWLTLEIGNGETVHVTFKNEAFTLPKDITGQTAVIEGDATKEETSVETLKRAAKSEGKTQEEIDAISQPITGYYFEADGVTLVN